MEGGGLGRTGAPSSRGAAPTEKEKEKTPFPRPHERERALREGKRRKGNRKKDKVAAKEAMWNAAALFVLVTYRGKTSYVEERVTSAARHVTSAAPTQHTTWAERESERERDTYFDDGVRRRGPPRSNGTRYKTFARVTLFHWHRKHE